MASARSCGTVTGPRKKRGLRWQKSRGRSTLGPMCSQPISPLSRPARTGSVLATKSGRRRAGYEYVLQPVCSEWGELAVQDLTRRHLDELIGKLRLGGLMRPNGKPRKAWSARSCNYMIGAISQVLGQLVAEGRLTRNVAALVDRVPGRARTFETFSGGPARHHGGP